MTVVSYLESGEPAWMGPEPKRETLDEFFRTELSRGRRRRFEAVCVDMWTAFSNSVRQWAPQSAIVYDKFPGMQYANQAVDEVRRAEFFRQGGSQRALVKGKRWLLLTRWMNLSESKQQMLNYYKVQVRLGVVEAINGNLRLLSRRGRGCQNLRYLLLKAQRLSSTRTGFVALRRAA